MSNINVMEKTGSHRDLLVYKRSMDLVVAIYQITSLFPDSEKFGLVSQLRRSAVSVPSNISEGAARQSTKEYIQFLYISLGSLAEIETQLEIAIRLNYCSEVEIQSLTIFHLKQMLLKMINSLKRKHANVQA